MAARQTKSPTPGAVYSCRVGNHGYARVVVLRVNSPSRMLLLAGTRPHLESAPANIGDATFSVQNAMIFAFLPFNFAHSNQSNCSRIGTVELKEPECVLPLRWDNFTDSVLDWKSDSPMWLKVRALPTRFHRAREHSLQFRGFSPAFGLPGVLEAAFFDTERRTWIHDDLTPQMLDIAQDVRIYCKTNNLRSPHKSL
ncbi:MAG TPA: hypothetical protein VHN77_11155 [Phycisphaerales bacterium]|nr:hypothetical protein [Phycisphaerales bacterium]